MPNKIVWDLTSQRFYETGVDHGVLYPVDANGTYPKGYAWNGLTTVTESPSGAEATALYADNIKYLNMISLEQFGATIEAYTYPKEFAVCDGSASPVGIGGVSLGQQNRKSFGLAYRTVLGNDSEGNSYGYKLHLIYGCLAAPSEKAFATINDSPSAITFSWVVSTTPVLCTGFKPLSSLTIDSTLVDAANLAALETVLYGVEGGADGRLPLPDEVISILQSAPPSALTVATVPADDAVGVAVTADVVFTFNNKISSESIVVATAAGVMVAGAKTWDVDHKVMTFNPTTNLAGGTTYIVTIAGVVDIHSQSLPTSVVNFGTA